MRIRRQATRLSTLAGPTSTARQTRPAHPKRANASRHTHAGKNNATSVNPTATTSVLTATTLTYAIGAGITAGAGTRLVLQLLLESQFTTDPFELTAIKTAIHISPNALEPKPKGNFARLLPSLEVGAISQAHSPGSNPNPLYPLRPLQSITPHSS